MVIVACCSAYTDELNIQPVMFVDMLGVCWFGSAILGFLC